MISTIWAGDLEAQGLWIYLWELPGQISTWSQDAGELDKYIKKSEGKNVYVGVTCLAQDPRSLNANPQKIRVTENTVGAWCGVTLDLDVEAPHRKKKGLFHSKKQALKFAESLPLPDPSLAVDSGAGIHLWWLYSEPWITSSKGERKRALDVSYSVNCIASSLAKKEGKSIDSTWDAARVLRAPGSVHQGAGVRVEILEQGDRISPSDLIDVIGDNMSSPKTRNVKHHDVSATEDAELSESIKLLAEVDLEIDEIIRGNTEFKSASERDASLATRLAPLVDDPQKIVDLCCYLRKKEGSDPIKHKKYWDHTLSGGRDLAIRLGWMGSDEEGDPPEPPSEPSEPPRDDEKGSGGGSELEAPKIRLASPETPEETDDEAQSTDKTTEARRKAALGALRKMTGVDAKRIIQYGEGQESQFEIVFESGERHKLGTAKEFNIWENWAALSTAEGAGPSNKPKLTHWFNLIRMLKPHIRRARAEGEDESAQTRGWIEEYLGSQVPDMARAEAGEKGSYLESNSAFRERNEIFIHLEDLRTEFIGLVKRQKLSRSDLQRRLRGIGFEPVRVTARNRAGSPVCRSYWTINAGELGIVLGGSRLHSVS